MRIETRGRVLFQNLRHIRRIGTFQIVQSLRMPCNVKNTHHAALVILRQADLLLGRHRSSHRIGGDPRVGINVAEGGRIGPLRPRNRGPGPVSGTENRGRRDAGDRHAQADTAFDRSSFHNSLGLSSGRLSPAEFPFAEFTSRNDSHTNLSNFRSSRSTRYEKYRKRRFPLAGSPVRPAGETEIAGDRLTERPRRKTAARPGFSPEFAGEARPVRSRNRPYTVGP